MQRLHNRLEYLQRLPNMNAKMQLAQYLGNQSGGGNLEMDLQTIGRT
jgi:hypothetical protein